MRLFQAIAHTYMLCREISLIYSESLILATNLAVQVKSVEHHRGTTILNKNIRKARTFKPFCVYNKLYIEQ